MAESLASIFVEISAKADDLTRVAARAQRDLQAVEAQAEALAATGAFDAAAAKAQAIERSLTWMARRSPEAMGVVQGEVKQLTAELERLKRASEATKVLRTLDDSMAGIGAQSSLLGRSYNTAAARADALKRAVVDLSKAGFSKQSKDVKDLTAQFKQATREAERHERAQRLLSSSMRGLKTAGKAVAATITGLAAAAVGFGAKAVQISGQIEVMRVSWQGLTGSAELAEETLQRLKEFQRKTPFAFPEIESAAKQLINYGFEVERVEELLTGLAAAAIRGGTGVEGIKGAAVALGQMRSMGKVAAQEINQLINAGVSAWPLMAKAMGMSVQELRDLMELAQSGKATVPAERVIWGLVREMSAGAEAMFGAYEDTLPGLTAKLADAVKGPMGLMAAVGEEIRDSLQIKQIIRGITVEVERWTKAIQERGLRQAWEDLAPPELRRFGDTVLQIANGLAHMFNVLRNHGLKGVWEQIVPDWVPGAATAIAVAIAGKAAFSIAASIGELVGALGATSGAGGIVAILGGMALWKWVVIAIAAAAAIYLIVKAVKALTKERKKHDSLPPFGSGMEALLSWEVGGKRAVQSARQTRDEVRDMYRTMAAGVTDSSRRAADALGVDFARASDGMLNAMKLAEDAMPELAAPQWDVEGLSKQIDETISSLERMRVALTPDDFGALALGAQTAQKRLSEWLNTLKDVEGIDFLRQNLIDLADGMEMLQVAAESGAGIETVQKAMALVQRQTELLQTTLADPSSWQAASTEAEALASTLREDVVGILADIEAGMSAADVTEAMSALPRAAAQGMGDLRVVMRDGTETALLDATEAAEKGITEFGYRVQTGLGASIQLFGTWGGEVDASVGGTLRDLSDYGLRFREDFPAHIGGTADAISSIVDDLREDVTGSNAAMFAAMVDDAEEFAQWAYLGSFWPDYQSAVEKWTTKTRDQSVSATRQMFQAMIRDSQAWDDQIKVLLVQLQALREAAAIYLIVKAVKALTKERKKHDGLPPFGSGMEALLSWETGGKRAVQAARQTRDEVRDMYRNMALGVTDSSRRAADALGVDFARASDGMLNAMQLAEGAMPELASPQWDVEGLSKQIDDTVSSLERMRVALTPDDFDALALGAQSAQKRLAEWLDTLEDVEGIDHLRQNLVDLAAGMELLQTAAESGLDLETVQQALTLVQRLTEQLQTTLRDPTSWQAASEEAAALAATLRNETATMLADIQADIAAADMPEAMSGLSDAVDIGTRAAVQAARLGIGDLRLVLRDGVDIGLTAATDAAQEGLDRFGLQLQTGLGTSVQVWSGWRADTVGIVDQLVGDLTDQGLRLRTDFPTQIGGTADAISSIMDNLREDVTGTNAAMFAAMEQRADEHAQWAYLGSFWPEYQKNLSKWTKETRDQSVSDTRQMFQQMVNSSKVWDNQMKVILVSLRALQETAADLRGPFSDAARGVSEAFVYMADEAIRSSSLLKTEFLSLLKDIEAGKKTWADFGNVLADVALQMIQNAQANLLAAKTAATVKAVLAGPVGWATIPAIVASTAGGLAALEAAKASIRSAKAGEGLIPGLADGGIVPATPGGRLYRLGEGGDDEAVIPLSRGRGLAASGGINIQITQPVIRRDEDVEWLGEQIVSTLRRMGVRP